MRLKSIKLAGFKSFVDPTTVHFPSNMCAVVGPNGCGKSNVIDAVRWVMGESSAKNLRGESMSDVIFNGSVNRQPVGQAAIELVFDNSDGGVGGEYASYAEISIKRQVSREGQSEYFLNGTRCRRRDITDIFLGTGLGPRSYAIIEQGTITRLIESRPEDLRVFIEEAAGISKYKERRRETENRMRRTLENLERLTDLRDELGRQLHHLQRQAKAAEKYGEFKSQERELKAQLLAMQWQALDKDATSAGQAIANLEVKLEAEHAAHQQLDTAIEKLRVEHSDHSDQCNRVQADYYSLAAEVSRIEQSIKHQQERGAQLRGDLQQTRASLTDAETELTEDRARLTGWETRLLELAPQLEQLRAAERSSGEALLQAEESMHNWQQQWDEFNHRAAEPRQQAEVQQSRIQHLEQVLQRVQARAAKLDEEKSALLSAPSDMEGDTLGEELATVELAVAGLESGNEALEQQIGAAREGERHLGERLNAARSRLQQLRGRQASLEALQQAAMEGADAGPGDWLREADLAEQPRLLECIEVDEGWQLAVETVLGDKLQSVCVEDTGQLAGLLGDLEQGQLSLIEAGAQQMSPPDRLSSRVRSGGRADTLLAGVRTADDLAQALQNRASLSAHESIITPDGLWFGPNWLRVSRRTSDQAGVIQRQQELDQLAQTLASEEESAGQLEQSLAQARQSLDRLEAERQNSQRELQRSTRQQADVSAKLSAHRARLEQVTARMERLNREIDEARQQFQQEQDAIAQARQLLAEAIENMDSDSQQRDRLMAARDAARSALDSARQKSRADRESAQAVAMEHQSLQAKANAIRDAIARADKQIAQLHERQARLNGSLSENDSPVDGLRGQLEQQLQLHLQAEIKLGEARQRVTSAEQGLREAEQQRLAAEQRVDVVRDELERERLAAQTVQVRRDTITGQLRETELAVQDLLQSMPDDANEADWQGQLERLANRIARLGAINLAAIDEYKLQSERKQYLDAQNNDLEDALETLRSAIRKIDKETRSRFQETFDMVNNGLQALFPRVFGGGSASLEMTGDDLLDTGISIMARPPGKKNSTIHLLSGGEKALTAIALVFSIFNLNPAPFCMLDEVDAPLDDANVGRYARMVREMSDKLQFIYITHNKISMEVADQLMGVTMHEPGVSRLVTVDVDEAAELAAS